MQYQDFIAQVRTRGNFDTPTHAEQATTTTLTVLGERLAGNEPHNLASQLPGELQPLLTFHTGPGERYDVDTFFRRIADQEGQNCTPDDARNHAHAVLSTLADAVTQGELDDFRSQLPSGYDLLLDPQIGN